MFKLVAELSNLKCPYVIITDDDRTICECQRAYCPFSHSLGSEEDDSSQMDLDQPSLEDSVVSTLPSDDNEGSADVPDRLSNDEIVQSQDSNLDDNSDDELILIEDDPDFDSDSSGQLHIVISSDEHSDKQDQILPSAVRNKKRKQRIIEINSSSSLSSSFPEFSPVSKSEQEPKHLVRGEAQNLRDETREPQTKDRTRDRHRSPEVIYTSDLLRKYNINTEDVLGKNFSCVLRLVDIGSRLSERAIATGSVSLPLCGLEQPVPPSSQYRASNVQKRQTPPVRSSTSSGGKMARKRHLSNGQHRTSGKHSRLHESPRGKRTPDAMKELFGDDNDSSDDFRQKRIPPRKTTPTPNRDKSQGQDPRDKSRKLREIAELYREMPELQKRHIQLEEVEELNIYLSRENNHDELRPLFYKTQEKMKKEVLEKRRQNERKNSSEPSTIKATVVSDVPSTRNGMSGTALSDVRTEPARLLVQKRKRAAHPAAESKRQEVKQTISSKQRPATYRQQLEKRREEIAPPIRRPSSDSERNLVKKQSKPSVVSMVGHRSQVAGSSEKKVSLLKRGQQQSINRFMGKPIPAASSISSRSLSMDSKPKFEPRIVVPSKQAPRSRVAHANAQSDEPRTPTPSRTIKTKISYKQRMTKVDHMYKVAMELFRNHTRAVAVTLAEEEQAAVSSDQSQIYAAKIVGIIVRWKKGIFATAAATQPMSSSPPPSMQLPAPKIIRQQRQSAPIVRRQQKQQQRQHRVEQRQSSPSLQNNSNLMKVSFNKPTRVAHGGAPSHSSAAYTSPNSSMVADTNVQPRRRDALMQEKAAYRVSSRKFFEDMLKFLMTEEQLEVNGYPRPTGTRGRCCFKHETSKKPKSVSRRKDCIRCTKEFIVSDHSDDDLDCYFHGGRLHSSKVGASWEKRYSCCQNTIGSSGCTWSQSHVHDDNKRDCSNYVKTRSREMANPRKSPGVYAIDCEMCYTVEGFELTRVSVISQDFSTKYDSFVKPKGRVLDYNTKWSGVEEKDLEDITTTIEDVQRYLLRLISAETILVGHSLESDLVALRMIHSTVVDTSIVFPHRMGPPLKRALRNLMVDKLGKVIQSADRNGHDSTEDAISCLQLMEWKIKDSRPAGEAS